MFRSARIKLTGWYLIIITLISLFFSVLIYRGLTGELERGLRIQAYRVLNPGLYPPTYLVQSQSRYDPQILEETERRILFYLFTVNLVVIGLAGVAGYFLAGLTLRPIEEMTREQTRFVADASHELRTPLTAMKTSTEVALRDKKIDLKATKEILTDNLLQVDKMQALTTSLLTLANYEEGISTTFEPVDLYFVANEALKTVEPVAKEKKIKIKKDLNPAVVPGDLSSLIELLEILLDNAIKYSPQDSEINLTTEMAEGRAQVAVKDRGIGMEENDQEHIFDRFYRAETSRGKDEVEGYGIGLALAKKIIDLHHGEIKVESKKGKGSTFTVSLPVKRKLRIKI